MYNYIIPKTKNTLVLKNPDGDLNLKTKKKNKYRLNV